MEKKEDINESLINLVGRKIIKVREIPEFPLSSGGKQLLIQAIKAVDRTIKDFKWQPEYDKILEWMEHPNRKGLHLTGDPGRLKTVIACQAIPLIFYHEHKLILRPVDAKDIESNYNHFERSPFVVVDDIGTENPINEYGIKREPFNTLVDFCEKNSKILIITSNLPSSTISQRYGIRTLDRIDLLCKSIRFQGESFR